MKTKLFNAIAISLLSTLISCGKSDENPLKNENFTQCPDNKTCSYVYSDYADVVDGRLSSGNKRVFLAVFSGGIITTKVYASTLLNNNKFLITDKQIKGGAVTYVDICPSCLSIPLKPTGGFVKGVKAEGNKWLIDAVLILQAEGVQYSDTLYLKQYFTPNFKYE